MVRIFRSVALLVDYLKKLSKPERVIDSRIFDYNAIYNRIMVTLAYNKQDRQDLCQIFGITPETPHYERVCKAPPTLETITYIADFLGVSVPWLLYGAAITPADAEVALHTTAAHVGIASNSTIIQGTQAHNIIIYQHKHKLDENISHCR